jgi:hypothetical protein
MHGRKCTRLLALSLFVLMPLSILCGQSDRAKQISDPAPDFLLTPMPIPPPGRPTILGPHVGGPIGLPQLTRAAGTIFSGTVTSIARTPATRAHGIETVEITFHVENAIRGVTPATDFTISQWIGVWSAGQRYRAGERVLLFLYPPSKLGLTSCVASPVGRFNINASGRMVLTAQQVAAFRADPVLGGKSRVSFSDFAAAVQQAGQEE